MRAAAGSTFAVWLPMRLAGRAAGLRGGLDRLGAAAHRLAGGLAGLQGGAAALQRGLADGFHRSYSLQRGLGRASVRVSAMTPAFDAA